MNCGDAKKCALNHNSWYGDSVSLGSENGTQQISGTLLLVGKYYPQYRFCTAVALSGGLVTLP